MKTRVGVLGSGSWGTTVAAVICGNADVSLWARTSSVADEINTSHTNSKYLPNAKLPPELHASAALEEVTGAADVLVLGVPSHGVREVIERAKPYFKAPIPIVSLTKGLEQGSHLRMTEVLAEILPEHPVGVLTGPNLAQEIMAGMPAASVIAMTDKRVVPALQKLFNCGVLRAYTSEDVIGCEIAGALKNVIAIACGMQDGLGLGINTRAMTITRGLMELTRLGMALGGKPATFSGMAGIGDLIATCSSTSSRNHSVGEELAKGRSLDDIIATMSMVAEGVKTAKVVNELSVRQSVDMPIARETYKVLYEDKSPMDSFRSLQQIYPGTELEPG